VPVALQPVFVNNVAMTNTATRMLDQPAPDHDPSATCGKPSRLPSAIDRPVALYFLPKDSYPGSTAEAQLFRDPHPECRARGCEIHDTSHGSITRRFKKLKHLYGKQAGGIERGAFVIDRMGAARREWRGHAQEVINFNKTLT